jgi:L-Ala-D/L-Glu epimerase
MRLTSIEIAKLKIPLIQPFITALRSTTEVEDIVLIVKTDNGTLGYGAAAATPVITGDSQEAIIGGLRFLANKLIGTELSNYEAVLHSINTSLVNNNGAKAAFDIAIHDIIAKQIGIPLYQFLGGGKPELKTLTTVSIKDVNAMVHDAKLFVEAGFETLKIKVGLDPVQDIVRIKAIREAVGEQVTLIIDANQGWELKAALNIINELAASQLNIAMVEQPVKAWDYDNLKLIRDQAKLPIFADESVFNVRDAFKVISANLADGINIKLMKSGGIYAARTIYDIATSHNVPCMAGAMLESPIGLAAMASFIASRNNIRFIDLDPITMLKHNPIKGGVELIGTTLQLSSEPGLGIKYIDGLETISKISME